MKKRNRFLAILLTLAMVSSMLPAGALAADPNGTPPPQVEEPAPVETPAIPVETPAAPVETPAIPAETPAAPAETPAEPPVVQVSSADNARANTTPGWNADGTTYTPTGIVNGGFEDGTGEPWYSDVGGLERSNSAATYFGSNGSIAEGSWMVEVCGDANAKTVYQNIATVPGEVIRWSLQHHTRISSSAADQIDVMFGPGGAAGTDARPANGIKQGDTRTAGAPNTADWKTHTGDYVVPIDQTSTCFYFSTVSPATGGSGNLIDDVKFQTLLSAPYVSATTKDVKVRIYCTLTDAPIMKFQAGEGHDAGTTFSAPKTGDYLEGTIPFASLPGGTDKITVWAEGYADFAQTVKVAPPTACYVKSDGNDTSGNGTATHPYATIDKAYTMAATGGEIRVLSDLTADAATTFAADKNITVTSYADAATPKTGGGWIVKRVDALKNLTAFTVSAGSVTLKNIVFDGGAVWSSAEASALLTRENNGAGAIVNVDTATGTGANFVGMLFTVSAGGALTLDSGAVLQNNDRQHGSASGGDRGSAVYVFGGTLTMNDGASIKNNRVTNDVFGVVGDGAAVSIWADGKFYMNGGSITGNTAGRMGGAIRVADKNSNMYLYGGSITGNATKSAADCGGISVNDGTLHLKGAPVVKDNLQNETECNIIYKATIVMDDRLTGGSIGVTGSVGNVTTYSAQYADLPYFHSDVATLRPYLTNGKQIALRVPPDAIYVAPALGGGQGSGKNGSDATGEGTSAWPYSTLAMAYSQVKDIDGTVYVMNDLAPTATTDFATAGKTVTITSCKADGGAWATAADTHTISRSVNSLFTINQGTVTLKNITLTDKTHHVNSPICIGNAGDAADPKLVMATGATITGTESNFGAVYMFKGNMEMTTGSSIAGNTNKGNPAVLDPQQGHGGGVYVSATSTLAMTGGTITDNKCTVANSRGGAVYAASGAKFQVQGDVKIFGNTKADSSVEGVYLMGQNILEVTGNLAATAHIDLGVDSHMAAGDLHNIGTASGDAAISGIAANLSAIVAAPFPSNLVAVRNGTTATKIQWAAADTNWLDQVATANYGWNDSNHNRVPDGITIDTPLKLYSLAYGIAHDYDPTNHVFDSETDGNMGASYANGFYDLTVNIDLSAFTWQPIGTTTIPFTGVFEGYPSAQTITGINHKAGLTENGLFGVVATKGDRTGDWQDIWKTTLIQNIIVDGGDKTWTSGTATHMGGIAAKATEAKIQNCAVQNLNLSISNTSASVFVGGIVGETLGTTCQLLNNTVGQTGIGMTLTSNTGGASQSAYAGGIVGKATGTAISGNTVGGNNTNRVIIQAVPGSGVTNLIYAGGVVGYMDGGTISNETWAHLNAMTVRPTASAAGTYAGGVAGYLAGAAAMTGCTPGANNGETHSIATLGLTGKSYVGGLVGGMSGTSSITNCTIGASDTDSYAVTAGVGAGLGAESVAGGLVGTMATGTSLTDCTISGDSIDSVKVTANGPAGTAGGLVGTAMDARVFKCSAQNITIAGGKTSGGLAGTFKATSLAADNGDTTAPGVMAMCYERNCEVTGIEGVGSWCDMIQTADKALILACYASKAAPNPVGVYAVKTATGSKFVGCYTSANQAPKFAYEGESTYDNCYFIGTGTSCAAADTVKGITADTMKAAVSGALTQMNSALQTAYDTVTGSLRMSYMSGNAPEIFGNYNYPMYAAWMLTVNTAPGSVYGSYTVTANGKTISAPGATGLNQYWVGNGAVIKVIGTPDGTYATAAATYKLDGTVVADLNSVAMDGDKVATVIFTPVKLPGWTINQDLTNPAVTGKPYTGVVSGALTATANKLTGNTVKSWVTNAGETAAWTANTRTIKTIFVTASTANGYNNPTIKEFTAAGWKTVTGGKDKSFVQLTSEVGMTEAKVAEVINSFTFAATKPEGGNVTVNVQVYVDENLRGAMYFNGRSVYELSGTPASYASAKLLAETSSFGGMQGHLVVIGDSAEHQFLVNNVKTNAWTAAVSTGDNTVLINWAWDVTGTPDASYLKNQSSWASGEPNKSGAYATYNYGGKLDDTNGANPALIEYDSLSVAATDWQADSALSTGSMTLSFEYPPVYPDPDPELPKKPLKPGEVKPVDPHKNGVSKLLEADKHIVYFVGDDSGKFNPERGITRAETAQIFYNLLKNKSVEQTVSFKDVEAQAWYAQAVNTLASLKIIEGRGDEYFDPMAYISRAEFTAIAMRFADSIKGTFTFNDVSADYWAESAISGAAQYGWIMGYEDGSFKPLENIKRAEAAKIVNTMLWRFPDTKFIDKAEGLKTFPDLVKGNWAYYDVAEATNAHDFTQTKTGTETWKK